MSVPQWFFRVTAIRDKLIEENKKGQKKTVTEIARNLHRKQEAISRDLHYLKSLKLIELKKKSKNVFALTELESINIQTSQKA